MVEFEVDQGGVGVGTDEEGALGTGGLDVPDVDVLEVGQALLGGYGGGEGDPIRRHGLAVGAGGQGGVAVIGVPVHGHADGGGDAGEGQVVDADVAGGAASGMGGLEEDSIGNAGEGGDVVGLDVVEAAGGLGADGDGGCSVADDGVAKHDVVAGTIDAEAVGVAAGLEA